VVVVENGVIVNGAISLEHPLPLANGCQVVVRVETAAAPAGAQKPPESPEELSSHPFFGQWSDRTDLSDGSDYVRQEREKWQLRATRQG